MPGLVIEIYKHSFSARQSEAHIHGNVELKKKPYRIHDDKMIRPHFNLILFF